jgi:adenine-specific DNA-methyltransferase
MESPGQAERYELNWVGKHAAQHLAQTPPDARLVAADGTPFDGDDGQSHYFIAGDNLRALKLLLPTFHERIKLIYIDPPYNTGNTFVYPDRFAARLGTYMKHTGQRAQDAAAFMSTPEAAGRFHSAWLSMMYPRLVIARQLLRDDGAIFISIGPEEIHHLLLLLHEIFGTACFKNIIVIRRGMKSVQAQFATIGALSRGHEYVVFFAKTPQARFTKLLIAAAPAPKTAPLGQWNNHWRGTDRHTMRYTIFGITPERGQWRWSEARSLEAIANYRRLCDDLGATHPEQHAIDQWVRHQQTATEKKVGLLRLSRRGHPEHYVPPTAGRLASDLWIDIKTNGPAQLRQIFGDVKLFDTPKSCDLLLRLLHFAAGPHDVILDFFAGSSTSAQAVLTANAADGGTRRFICAQDPVPLPAPVTLADGTTLRTIADIGRERIRRVSALLTATDSPAHALGAVKYLHEASGTGAI